MFGDLVNMLTTVTPRIGYVADALSPDLPLGDSRRPTTHRFISGSSGR